MNKLRAEGALLAEPFDFKSEEVQLTICSVPNAGTPSAQATISRYKLVCNLFAVVT